MFSQRTLSEILSQVYLAKRDNVCFPCVVTPPLINVFSQRTLSEILSQVYLARQVIAEDGLPALHNVVFMGMGEPLNNIKHVAKAATVMSDHRYASMRRRIHACMRRRIHACMRRRIHACHV